MTVLASVRAALQRFERTEKSTVAEAEKKAKELGMPPKTEWLSQVLSGSVRTFIQACLTGHARTTPSGDYVLGTTPSAYLNYTSR